MDDAEGVHDGGHHLQEEEEGDAPPRGDGPRPGPGAGPDDGWGRAAEEAVSRAELEVSFGYEKLLNLEILVMEVARRATDVEPLALGHPGSISAEAAAQAFEFDVLYGILDSEVRELEKLVGSIRIDIGNAEMMVAGEESASRLKGKLHGVAGSLEQMQEVIATIRRETANFERILDPSHDKAGASEDGGGGYENGHASSHTTMQAEDQRNVLQMLEQSIAGELDLEKQLLDSRAAVEELKSKLHHVEHESYFLEESAEAIYGRTFAAENASELFLATSKELIGKINTIQFHLSASIGREGDLKSKVDQRWMRSNSSKTTPEKVQENNEHNVTWQAEHSRSLAAPEFLILRDKVQQLEGWLMESGPRLQLQKVSTGTDEEPPNLSDSELGTFGYIIHDLKDAISRAESSAQNTEARCAHLFQANTQLSGELNSLKSKGSDRVGLLEKKLKESDAQLEHAKASVEAIVEHQGMLKSSMSDMEQMIEDLKEKYLKAETRAENAESKCTLLTDTNLELSEELSFLRGRVESLENSLHQANQLKMSTAKDIGIKTKTITDLVAKLALERGRLHLQVVTLTKKNRVLAQKCKQNTFYGTLWNQKVISNEGELNSTEVIEEVVTDSSSTQTKVKATAGPFGEEEAEMNALLEDESSIESTLETVRSIEPKLLNWKYIFAAFLVLLTAILVYLMYQ